MPAARSHGDVVRALLAAVPNPDDPLVQAVVASPATSGTAVRVLLDPGSATVTVVKRFSFVTAPTAGQTVWLLRAGRSYLCLGTLA